MRNIFIVFLVSGFLFCQDQNELFDPNSNYIERGQKTVETYQDNDSDIDGTYDIYNKIAWRTVAVNPKNILPGSVLFIPQFAGYKISDVLYHDGYFFAQQVLNDKNSSKIKIYTTKSIKLTAEKMAVYVVQGVMAKSLRLRYELQYRTNKEKPTFKMVASDFNKMMQWGNRAIPAVNQRIQKYSEMGKGTPYLIYNLGEGAESLVDPDPTIDFARTDCMTFCEHTLALAISHNYHEMYNNLQKIRYKDGMIGYTTRNHYTIVDWLPNNSWLLEDVTSKVGAGYAKEITKEIDRPAFYRNNGVPEKDLAAAPQKKKLTIHYIPTRSIMEISDSLRGGEIVSIITTHPAVFSAHMGIIIRDQWDNLIFRHASSSEQTNEVMDERLSDYVNKLSQSKSRVGMLFMRVRDNYKIPQ